MAHVDIIYTVSKILKWILVSSFAMAFIAVKVSILESLLMNDCCHHLMLNFSLHLVSFGSIQIHICCN